MRDETLEKAAYWYDSRGELSDSEREEFLRWLNIEEHRLAYEKIVNCMDSSEILAALTSSSSTAGKRSGRLVNNLFARPGQLAAAASFVALGLITLFTLGIFDISQHNDSIATINSSEPNVERYATERAIRTSRLLSDGSQVHLNARSSIVFEASESERRITLTNGQVLFDVAHDSNRPFVVDIGNSQVSVLGTVFDVERAGEYWDLHVYDGAVNVSADKSVTIYKGQKVSIFDNKIGKIEFHGDLRPSWQTGWLEIDQEPLNRVVTKFQRYIDKTILLDASSGVSPEHRVSGRFDLSNPLESLLLLSKISDLELDIQHDYIHISKHVEAKK